MIRRRLAIAAVAGAILCSVVAVWRFSVNPVFSPGALAAHHGGIADNCAACHATGRADAPRGNEPIAGRRDRERALCQRCHDFGQFSNHAHSLNPVDLAAVTAAMQIATAAAGSATPANSAAQADQVAHTSVYCADCHREHQGAQTNLAAMADRQCQSCHAREFHSFSDGHAAFSDYPYERRTRIYFDHMTHYGTHFANFKRGMPHGEAPQSCRACHQFDESGRQRLAGGFDRMCGSCHGRQIEKTPLPGLAFFALPALDLATLRAKQVPIGEWPKVAAPGDSNQMPPPLMQLLLDGDVDFAEANAALDGADLRFLGDAGSEQLQAVENYVWAIKLLLYELVQEGPDAVRRRVAHAVGSQASPRELAELTDVAADVFSTTQSIWFPNLNAELERRRGGDRAAIAKGVTAAVEPFSASRQFGGGWYADDRDCSIRYRPSQHADQFLRVWLEVSARVGVAETAETAGQGDTPSPLELRDTRALFKSLTSSASPGRCMKCHTVDATPAGGLTINWRGLPEPAGDRSLTRFSHLPHVSKGAENCGSCHKFDEQIDFFRAEFRRSDLAANTDADSINTSGFQPIQNADCAQCHTRKKVRDTCLTCHNYHAGQFPSTDWSAIRQHVEVETNAPHVAR